MCSTGSAGIASRGAAPGSAEASALTPVFAPTAQAGRINGTIAARAAGNRRLESARQGALLCRRKRSMNSASLEAKQR